MATKRKPKSTPEDALKRYEEIFENITCFTDAIAKSEGEIEKARAVVDEARAKLDSAKAALTELVAIQDGNKQALYAYLHPKNGEILPLFDRMEPANEEKHGVKSDEWRKEPISALGLSLPSLKCLTDADIVLVGQLQDLVLANPDTWSSKIPNITAGVAAAIVDRLNDFIFERSSKE